MADEVTYAECPFCRHKTFRYLDTAPGDDYPRTVFECTECLGRWSETQLKGIEWIEFAF